MKNHRDQLIDMLLAEELGGDTPPDLVDAVLRCAFPRRRWFRPMLAAGAAAAVLLLVLTGWLLLRPPHYPEPSATGAFEVVGSGSVQRGAVLRTGEQPARLDLGGYVNVDLRPGTQVRIAGEKSDERLDLDTGELQCTVAPGRGAFSVRTPVGTVSVLGTQFTIKVFAQDGDDEMFSKNMFVKVLVGTVLVTGPWGAVELTGGQERLFGQEKKEKNPLEGKKGKTIGVLTEKGPNFIAVKADGEEKGRRYVPQWVGGNPAQGGGPDKNMLKIMSGLKVGSRVEVDWLFEERLRLLGVKVLKAAPVEKEKPLEGKAAVENEEPVAGKTGSSIGILTEMNGAAKIYIRADGEKMARHYTVRWLKEGKKFDPELIKQFQSIPIGSRIEAQWAIVDPAMHMRIYGVKVLKAAEIDKENQEESAEFAQDKRTKGVIVGVVTNKGNSKTMNNAWVEIKADGEDKGRGYYPAGGPDHQKLLAAIRAVAIGARVRIEWIGGDGKDITKFEVLKAAPGK